MRIKDIKYKIKYFFQRAKKGYCDEDLFSIDNWFYTTLPKMLGEFANCTCGHPCNIEDLKEEVKNFPELWCESQRAKINKIGKKYDEKYNLNNGMCCWLLIILRLKHDFELCDEWNPYYDIFTYNEKSKEIERYKKEAFYLLEKYFWDLWW